MYTLAYDASTSSLNWALLSLVLLGPIFAFIIRKRGKARAGFLVAGAGLWILLTGVGAANVNYQIWQCRQWARAEQYQLTEGVVSEFHPMPITGHDSERFVLNGVRFEYSDFDLSKGGFNNTRSHSGPIREGLRVKIAYRDGRILKLWVSSSPRDPR